MYNGNSSNNLIMNGNNGIENRDHMENNDVDSDDSDSHSSSSSSTTTEEIVGGDKKMEEMSQDPNSHSPLINRSITNITRRKRAGSKSKRICRTLTTEETLNLSILKKERTMPIIRSPTNKSKDTNTILTSSISPNETRFDPRSMFKAKSSMDLTALNISSPKLISLKKETYKTLENVKWNPNLRKEQEKKIHNYISISDNFNMELGYGKITEDIEDFSPTYQLEDLQSYKNYYSSYFYKKEHLIYLVEDISKADNNAIVCIRCHSISNQYLCFFITRRGFQLHYIPYSILFPKRESLSQYGNGQEHLEVLSSKNKSVMKKVEEICETILLKIHKEPSQKMKFHKPINSSLFSKEIYQFEKDNTLQNIKIGVLYTKDGDIKEDDIYNNESPKSEAYEEFLGIIGKEITLENYRGFRGGLDVKKNTTGEKSLINTLYYTNDGVLCHEKFTIFSEHVIQLDVMFHVATMLPFSHVEKHQLAKKRHIGNDVVVIVFNDGNKELNFEGFQSQFNHAFIVITPLTGEESDHYNISIVTKKEVKPCRPFLPEEGKIRKEDLFEFLMTKSFNLEKASLYANTFSTKTQRTFVLSIADFFKNFKKK